MAIMNAQNVNHPCANHELKLLGQIIQLFTMAQITVRSLATFRQDK